MKQFSLLFLAAGACGITAAQDTDTKPVVSKSAAKDMIILNLTMENWMNTPKGITVNNGKSRGFSIHSIKNNPLGSSNFSLGVGIGVGWHGVDTDVNWEMLTVDSSDNSINYSFDTYPSALKLKKNKLATTYLDVPVELRFKTKPNANGKSFKVTAGFVAGYLLNSHTKYKDDETKQKEYNLKNVNSFRYGVTGRIGFGKIGIFGYYALSTLFSEGKGSEITPFSVGLSLLPY